MRKKLLIALALAVPLMAVSACSAPGDLGSPQAPDSSSSPSDDAEAPSGPDTSDVPDVVATVNGHDIKKDEFDEAYSQQYQQAMMQAQQTGQQPDEDDIKSQTADILVNTELILQEADKKGVSPSDSDVDDKIDELAEQQGMDSADDFLAALKEQGISGDEVHKQVVSQLKIDAVIDDEAGSTDPSDDDVKQLYDQLVEQQKQGGTDDGDIPDFDDIKDSLAQQLKQQNQDEAANRIIDKLRDGADITVNL